MIMLSRLSGNQFVLNSDLVERIDATPDTVVTLTDGTKYVVSESLTEVISRVRRYRAEIVALSAHIDVEDLVGAPRDPERLESAASRLASVTPLPAGSPAPDSDEQDN